MVQWRDADPEGTLTVDCVTCCVLTHTLHLQVRELSQLVRESSSTTLGNVLTA